MFRIQTSRLLAGFVIALTLAILVNIPTGTPYSPLNTGPRGYSKIADGTADIYLSPTEMGRLQTPAIIIPINTGLSSEAVAEIAGLVEKNKTIIILDNNGYAEGLLQQLGIKLLVDNHTVIDDINSLSGERYDIIVQVKDNMSMIINRPRSLKVYTGHEIIEYYNTSGYAYIDENGDGTYTIGEPMGNITVGFAVKINNSIIVYLSSLTVFSNELLDKNHGFLQHFTSGGYSLYVGNLGLSELELWRIDLYRRIHSIDRDLLGISLYILGLPVLFYITGRKPGKHMPLKYLYVYTLSSMLVFTAPLVNPEYVLGPVMLGLATILLLMAMFMAQKYTGPYPILSLSLSLSVYPGLLALSTLLLLASLPLFINQERTENSFMGSTSILYVKTLASMLVFVPIVPLLTAPILVGFSAILFLTTYYYVQTGKITVELIYMPRRLFAGREEALIFNVKGIGIRFLTGFFINDRLVEKVADDIRGYTLVYYSNSVIGRHQLSLKVYAYDGYMFSSRKLLDTKTDIVVLPAIPKIVADIRARSARRGLLRSLIESLRGEAVILSGRGWELYEEIKITGENLRGIIGRLINAPGFAASFLKPLLESIAGLMGVKAKKWYGEYRGVRYYVAGDPVRLIHWKKSVSRNMLHTREYEVPTSGSEEAGRGRKSGETPLLITIFIDSANRREFEFKVNRLITTLYNVASRDPEFKLMLSIVSGSSVLTLHARADELLTILIDTLERQYTGFTYEYEPVGGGGFTVEPSLTRLSSSAVNTILWIHSTIAAAINKSVQKLGINPPIYYSIIDSRSVEKRSLLVRSFLEALRYRYIPLDNIDKALAI